MLVTGLGTMEASKVWMRDQSELVGEAPCGLGQFFRPHLLSLRLPRWSSFPEPHRSWLPT